MTDSHDSSFAALSTSASHQDRPASPGAGTAAPVRYDDGGKVYRSYLFWLTLFVIAVSAVFGASGLLLSNQVQDLSFNTFFIGANAGTDLTELTGLRASVNAGTVTPTAAQVELLRILTQYEAARANSLAIVTSIGTLVTMFAQPLIGVFSDRTRSKWGRRAPWILYGALFGAMMLATVRFAPTVVMVAVTWAIAQLVLNTALAPAMATVADRVPEERLGAASTFTGLGGFVGGVLGGIGGGALFAMIGLNYWFVLALAVALTGVLFFLRTRDNSSKQLNVTAFRWRTFLLGFVQPLRANDFRWAWIARVLLMFGFFLSNTLAFFMLQSYITPALSQAEATALAPLLALAALPFTIIGIAVAGKWSDKINRRKPFVTAASLLMTVSMLVPLISATVPGLFVQSMLASLAFGIYLPVDTALMIAVLPNKQDNAGRDLGIAGLATNLGQTLAPLLAAGIVAVTAGYAGVWIGAAVLVTIAAFAVVPIKGAR